jgi:small subunit ribosomal protein S9
MMTDKKPYGLGRRKTSVAQVWLTNGATEYTVNSKPMADYFPTTDMRAAAQQALVLTNQLDQYGVKALVHGGGKRSQADAVKLAIARALLGIDAKWRKQLKDAGLLTRDSRMKERKKPGLKRARRAPQFSKR